MGPGAEPAAAPAPWEEPPAAPSGGLADPEDLRRFVYTLRRRLPVLLLSIVACTAITAVYSFRQPKVYAAAARLHLARELPDPANADRMILLEGIAQPYLNTQVRVLESYALAERVLTSSENEEIARELEAAAVAAAGPGYEPPIGALVGAFRAGIRVAPLPDTYLVDVVYESEVRERCDRYANALVQAYIDMVNAQLSSRAAVAVEKITEQTELHYQRMIEKQEELTRFLQTSPPMLPQLENLLTNQVLGSNVALETVQRERIALESELDAIRRVVENDRPVESAPAIATNDTIQHLRRLLADAELELAVLEEQFGPDWAAVRGARVKRDQLKLLLRQEIEVIRSRLESERFAKVEQEQGLLARHRQLTEQAREMAQRARQYENLLDEVETSRRFYQEFSARLKDTTSVSDLVDTRVRFVDRAAPAGGPIRPRHSRDLVLGFMAGVALGLGLVLLLERLEDRIPSVTEATRALGLPVLSVIPEIAAEDTDLFALAHPSSVYSEAFRRLRVQLAAVGAFPAEGCGVLLCASGLPREGKTVCSLNLAIAMAQAGERTLLIDGDMRSPRVHRILRLSLAPGLAEQLVPAGTSEPELRATEVANLFALTAGRTDDNPAELLARGDALGELVQRLRGQFDRIVIDTPPLSAVTDAALMAPFADATVLIVSGRHSSRTASQVAATELGRVRAAPRGVLFNHQHASDAGYYYSGYYRYGYGYGRRPGEGEDEPPPPPAASA